MSTQKLSSKFSFPLMLIFLMMSIFSSVTLASDNSHIKNIDFPRNPEKHQDKDYKTIFEIITHRIAEEHFIDE